jgi:hypothetical protein
MAKKDKCQYQLIHVWGLVEPCLWGKKGSWDDLEKCILNLLKDDSYDPDESGVFFLKFTASGRLKDICPFSNGYMDEMSARADAELKTEINVPLQVKSSDGARKKKST